MSILVPESGNIFPVEGPVSCSGIEGSNAEDACRILLPGNELVYASSFRAVFESVKSGQCVYGVLPIENSSYGSVRAVYDLMIKYRFYIVRSLKFPVHHCLLAKKGTRLEDIRRVYSHPQALGQCSEFLDNLNVEAIPFSNTATAAKMISESANSDKAAIASIRCAELYNLECLSNNIQDSKNNFTKFICISKSPVITPDADHISLVAGCRNVPGALSAILEKIAARNVNVNTLESCPVANSNFEYMFFLELRASVKEPVTMIMLNETRRACGEFIFLGNYLQEEIS